MTDFQKRTPTGDAPCPEARQQRVPYRNGSVCVSSPFAEFLACLELNKLEEVADDAKKAAGAKMNGGYGPANVSASAEANAVSVVQTKYSSGALPGVVDACIKKYSDLPPAGRPPGASASGEATTTAPVASSSASPEGPATLVRATVRTRTKDDNKDHDTGVFITVKTSDGAAVLAEVKNAHTSSSDSTEHRDPAEHVIELELKSPGATKSACKRFQVHMWQETKGHDTWRFDVSVTLHFSDNTTLDAGRENVELKDNGASTDF